MSERAGGDFAGVLDGRRRTASLTLIILTVFKKTPAWFVPWLHHTDQTL